MFTSIVTILLSIALPAVYALGALLVYAIAGRRKKSLAASFLRVTFFSFAGSLLYWIMLLFRNLYPYAIRRWFLDGDEILLGSFLCITLGAVLGVYFSARLEPAQTSPNSR